VQCVKEGVLLKDEEIISNKGNTESDTTCVQFGDVLFCLLLSL